jgi:hypothetical protein
MQGTIKDRTKVMRGLEFKHTAELFLDGFTLHYNHMRSHHAIGKPPAKAAGLPLVFRDWTEVAHIRPTHLETPKGVRRSGLTLSENGKEDSRPMNRYHPDANKTVALQVNQDSAIGAALAECKLIHSSQADGAGGPGAAAGRHPCFRAGLVRRIRFSRQRPWSQNLSPPAAWEKT